MPDVRYFDKTGETLLTGDSWPAILAGKPTDESGTAQAGTANTITLASGSSSIDDDYKDLYVSITSGTGSGQIRLISGYVGSTKVATVSSNWGTNPNNTSVYRVFETRKYAVQNISGRVFSSSFFLKISAIPGNDGSGFARTGLDTVTLTCPYGVTAVDGGAGGSWSGGTGLRYYRVTALNATGETVGSIEISYNVSDTARKVQLNWTTVTGATSYKVYRSTTPGTYTTPALVASPGTNSYLDTGSATGAGALPSANTTGNTSTLTYGVPPSMNTIAIVIGALAIGQQAYFWVEWVVGPGITSVGNTRAFLIEPG